VTLPVDLVSRIAEEKQLIHLVAAGLGVAIVPRWMSRMATQDVRYILLESGIESMSKLPLAAAWLRRSRDAVRDEMIHTLQAILAHYAEQA
jgi:DNA-binding transcriptional LysR family regulator